MKLVMSSLVEANSVQLDKNPLIQGSKKKQSTSSLEKRILASKNDYDPFYLADIEEVDNLYEKWNANLPGIKPFYAVKCNADRKLLERLISLGAGFDCASEGEIRLLLELGASPDKIVFANPCKSISHIKFAKDNGIDYMTFDNLEELDKIYNYHPKAKLIIRIKTNDESSICPISIKFGTDIEDVPLLFEKAMYYNLDLVGVSFHVGSGCTDPGVFHQAISDSRKIFAYASRLGIDLYVLDIGGGFSCAGLDIDESISFESITEVIRKSIQDLFGDLPNVNIIAEPGRYFASSVFTLITRVCSIRNMKKIKESDPDIAYYINDGLFGNFTYFKINARNPNWQLMRSTENGLKKLSDKPELLAWVWGPTCCPIDFVVKNVLMPKLEVGDWIVVPNIGAYTTTIATEFNGFPRAKIHYI